MKAVKTKIAVALIMSIILFTGCKFNNSKDAIIMINGEAITKQQYEKEFEKLASNPTFKQMGVDVKNNADGYIGLMLKDKVINELIVKTILNKEIEKRGIKVKDEDINQELKKIIDKVGSKDKFNEILKQSHITSSQFKSDLREEVKIQKLVDSLTLKNITDEAAQKFYNSNIDKFKYPDKVKASHILISADEDTIRELIKAKEGSNKLTEEQIEEQVQKEIAGRKQKAEKILVEVKKDPSRFEQLAKENSDDPGSAQQGGDL